MRGRGTSSNVHNRFQPYRIEAVAVDEFDSGEVPDSVATEVRLEHAKSIIATNQSPDIPFDRSINPYRGCEHGCIYCFARPSHAYWDLSPGLDFETRLTAKVNAVERLVETLDRPGYKPAPLALGVNTDAYQPIEKEHRLTRQLLEVLQAYRHPVTIITKGTLVLRDLDILADMASQGLCSVRVSLTTLDNELKRTLEPRAAGPAGRLKVLRALSEARIPCGIMIAPVIPFVNDAEIESILDAALEAGADRAGWVLLRLPREVAPLFEEWLQTHMPDRASHVMNRIRDLRGGNAYDSSWGSRMRGQGPYASLLSQRFEKHCRKIGMNRRESEPLRSDLFRRPGGEQLGLF
ncbi:MAG: radical SAM protein [Alteromonadaceae bacterium]|nr:radical SAM protein [Alteromonadaceae bacterium]